MKEYMNNVCVADAIKAGRTDTICWDCKNACGGGGCSWTDPKQQSPVTGWAAEETAHGYRVIACPLFKRGTYGAGMYRTADDYILALEIEVTDLKNQINNLKKTLWWKYIHKIRCTNRELQSRNKRLEERLEELEKGGAENGSEE